MLAYTLPYQLAKFRIDADFQQYIMHLIKFWPDRCGLRLA